tara:strand:+ start:510 stop:668 length:159 start_codon:yes stop_codon:yes gene_type:complete
MPNRKPYPRTKTPKKKTAKKMKTKKGLMVPASKKGMKSRSTSPLSKPKKYKK